MRRLSAVALASGVLAAWLVVTSLGGSAGASTSSAPIVVGGDGDSLSPGVAAGFEAGIYRFNKAGGLDGRKIQFTGFLDDGFSGQTNLTNAQQLVENRHVMAVVPYVSAIATAATSSFLVANKVPFIGWATNSAYVSQPTWGLPINGDQGNPNVQAASGNAFETIAGVNSPSKVRMAFVAENIAAAIDALHATSGAGRASGAKIVYENGPIALGAASYAPYAQAILATNPNIVFEVTDNPDGIGLAAALRAAGYKGGIVNGVSYLPGELSSQPNEAAALNGVYVIDQFPADENKTPAVLQAQKDLVSVGQKPYLTAGVSQGYWSAIVFEQMLKATLKQVGGDPSKVTGPALQKAVNNKFVYTDPLAGGIGTEYFPTAETITTGCSTLVRVSGTGYKQILPFTCLGAINVKTGKKLSQITGKPVS